MNNTRSFAVALGLLPVLTSTALPHDGPRVWLSQTNTKSGTQAATYISDNDIEPTSYAPSRLFTGQFDDIAGVFTTDFPGFEVRRDNTTQVAVGTFFGFDLTGPLRFYDASASTWRTVEQQFPTPTPQLQLVLSGETSGAIVTSGSPQPGFNVLQFTSVGDHGHLDFTLLGDGVSPTSPASDGVYAVPMRITSSAASPSQEIFILLGRNVSPFTPLFNQAVADAQTQLIPEPTVFALLTGGALVLLRRRR